jgi:DNA-binding transcriptional ArsR family regulator
MVEYTFSLDSVFGSLADPTRRDILQRIASAELSVSEIAEPYDLTLAAVSKHLKILEKARLVVKRRQGKQQLVSLSPYAFKDAAEYMDFYKKLLKERMDSLEEFLNKEEE